MLRKVRFRILLLAWILQLMLKETNFSVVIDHFSQTGIFLSEYCPKARHCNQLTHVMCMYYNPNRIFGHICEDMKNISMTSELSEFLLDIANEMRARVARGIEKGKGEVQLPRGYGIFKLQWDNELATFAQVLANQCSNKRDLCRATKRFPSPGQVISYRRAHNMLNEPITQGSNYLTHAINVTLRYWYGKKREVTERMIADYQKSITSRANLYLDLIHGPTTHMGCGISAFVSYEYNVERTVTDTVLLVCNLSEQAIDKVYDVTPGNNTSECGCPAETEEDDNCLCSYVEEHYGREDCHDVSCRPTVVLLPIFTVEDAPQSKLIALQGTNINEQLTRKLNPVSRRYRPNHLSTSMELLTEDFPGNNSQNKHSTIKVYNGMRDNIGNSKQHHAPNRKVFEKPPPTHSQHLQSAANQNHQRKTSIFSRSVIMNKGNNNPLKFSLKDFKKDVIPRKDFSKAKHLVSNYMESLKNYTTQFRPHERELKERISIRDLSGSGNLNNAEENVLDNHYNNFTFQSEMGNGVSHDTGHELSHEIDHERDLDTKLMTLLDKLEEEVQHIEFKGNKKELFDARIRKIYDKVVKKSSGELSPRPQIKHYTNSEIRDIDKISEHDFRHKMDLLEGRKEIKMNDIIDIGKTIDDLVQSNRNDEFEHRNNLDDESETIHRRNIIKARLSSGYATGYTDSNTEFDFRPNSNKNQIEKLAGIYRDFEVSNNKEYEPYRYVEHRKSYIGKIQDSNHDDYRINRFNIDDRKAKRYKHTRDYYKTRNPNNIESYNINHYRRHQTMPDNRIIDDDVLNPERRKYYQERLENLERKLKSSRLHKFRNEEGDHRRRSMRMPIVLEEESLRRPSKSRMDHFDMRERSRFIHGY